MRRHRLLVLVVVCALLALLPACSRPVVDRRELAVDTAADVVSAIMRSDATALERHFGRKVSKYEVDERRQALGSFGTDRGSYVVTAPEGIDWPEAAAVTMSVASPESSLPIQVDMTWLDAANAWEVVDVENVY